jgi:hypothetical protein
MAADQELELDRVIAKGKDRRHHLAYLSATFASVSESVKLTRRHGAERPREPQYIAPLSEESFAAHTQAARSSGSKNRGVEVWAFMPD